MRLRISPVMTLFAVPALAVLLALGVWQLQRAEEKRAAIEAYEAVAAQEPAEFDEVYCGYAPGAASRPVAPTENLRGQVVRYFGARGDGEPGWRLLRLAAAPSCGGADEPSHLFMQTGFETLDGDVTGPAERYAVAPPPRANMFTPANPQGKNEFYRFDASAMAAVAAVDGAEPRADAWLAPADVLPPALADMPPSRHIGYALTWFGLALTLIGVYAAYHLRAARERAEG